MKRPSVSFLLQLVLAAVLLLATAWLLWPWPDRQVPAASFLPTLTPTITWVKSPTRVPSPTSVVPTATPEPVIHIVQPKEVLGIIAQQYGVSVEEVMAANNIEDANMVGIGRKLVIPNPQRTPVFTPTPTAKPGSPVPPTPTSTPTLPWRDVAPVLLGPADGEVFQGEQAVIALRWASTATLGESEYYEIRLWSVPQGEAHPLLFYSQASTWVIPAEFYSRSRAGTWYWTVAIVYRARQDIALSAAPGPWHFEWR
jgi:LysM repeat protein